MWGWHAGGAWWAFMAVGMIVFWTLVAWLLITFARADGPRRRTDAQAILDARYARGEIDEADYHRRSEDLRATSSG